jgi:hypothetical protein
MTSDPSASSQAPASTAGFLPLQSTLLGDIVAKLLGLISAILSPGLLENSLGASKRLGHYTVLAGAVLTVIYGLIMAIKLEAFQLLITALLFVGVIAVAQFAAGRFLDAADKIIRSTQSRVSSPAFFECVGLISIILAIALLLSGLGAAIYMRSFPALVLPLILVVIMVSFATIMLHPNIVNVAVGEGTAGEEAIGIITTFMKAKLKLVPLVFFLFAILGSLIVLAGFFGDRFAMAFAQYFPFSTGGLPFGFVGAALIVVACMVPILVYFVFLLQYLFLDVIRAVLAVPGKLDSLRR